MNGKFFILRRRTVAQTLAVCFYVAACVLAYALIADARASAELERALSQMDSAEERTDSLVKGWLETLSFGFYEGAREKARGRAELEQAMATHAARVETLSLSLAFGCAAFLLVFWLCLGPRDISLRPRLLFHLHGVAALSLLVGLMAPMLSVVAQREIAMLGNVVLQFQSKGILDTVFALFARGSVFTAVMLGVFSVLVPILKLCLSFFALVARSSAIKDKSLGLVKAIGKWSMTDVFVVAILLAFLALGDGALTDARLGPGLYFFAAYGLLSLLGGIGLSHVGEQRGNHVPQA